MLLIQCVSSGVKGVSFAEFLVLSLLVMSNQKLNKSFKIKVLVLLSMAYVGLLVGLLLMPTFKQIFEPKSLLLAIFSLRNDNSLQVFSQITRNNYNVLIGTLE